jgi:hypothetical protein
MMERQAAERGLGSAAIQCVVALAIIMLAFWVSDVAPGQPEAVTMPSADPRAAHLGTMDEAVARASRAGDREAEARGPSTAERLAARPGR